MTSLWKGYPYATPGGCPQGRGRPWGPAPAVAVYNGRNWRVQATRRYYFASGGPVGLFVWTRRVGRPIRDKFDRLRRKAKRR